MKLGVCLFALTFAWAPVWMAPAAGQQYTARFFTNYGSPFKGERILFSPTGFYMAVLVEDHQTHIFHVDSGRETKKYAMQPVAMAFTADGYRLLAVDEQHTVLMPVDGSLAVDAPWRLPSGYLGITFTQQAGKLLIESLAPSGPAAVSGQLHVGDELIAIIIAGKEQSVLGASVPSVIKELAGLAGTNATLRIVPRGAADAKNVTLRRAAGTKQNNQVHFQAWTARSSPQSLVVRQQNALLVIDANGAAPISAIEPQEIEPFGFQTFSPDGRLLAVTGHRRRAAGGEAKLGLEVFDVARQERLLVAPVDATNLYEQRFTPDGKRILWGAKDRILVYDLERRAMAPPILIGFDPSRYQPREKKENDEYFSPLNLNARYDDQRRDDGPAAVEYPEQLLAAFDVSPDGKLVAVGSAHGELRLFSTNEHKELAKIGDRTQQSVDVKPVRFSPDGKWLAYYLEGTLHWQTVVSILADHKAP